MSADQDAIFLRRAIRLAMNGRGFVEPNPMVGCVLVRDGQIIGEGFHAKFGGPHAEPAALADCRGCGNDPAGATAYVTLEPCCHLNKKTPPCAPQLIAAKIARVVIGCLDPNPAVNGNGVAMLRAAGIAVDGPLLEAESRQLIAPFLASTQFRRPYVTLKWAETADGKISGPGGQRLAITGGAAQALVHQLRARVDGIAVGVTTVLTDDPLLNARLVESPRHPLRYILDTRLRTPPDAQVVFDQSASTTILYAHNAADKALRYRRDALENAGAHTVLIPIESAGKLSIPRVLSYLHGMWTQELLVEPGPTLARSFFAANLVDRLWVFRSAKRIGDATAIAAAEVPVDFVATETLDVEGDQLTEYLNRRSPVFFSASPSADIVVR